MKSALACLRVYVPLATATVLILFGTFFIQSPTWWVLAFNVVVVELMLLTPPAALSFAILLPWFDSRMLDEQRKQVLVFNAIALTLFGLWIGIVLVSFEM
jgi:hypothetical protein